MSDLHISDAKDQLKSLLGSSAKVDALIDKIEQSLTGKTLTVATARFWYDLLKDFDFLILDGDDAQLKEMFANQLREEISTGNLNGALSQTENEMQEAGYKVQAPSSPVNLFRLTADARIKIK